jgi:hypothetical protein
MSPFRRLASARRSWGVARGAAAVGPAPLALAFAVVLAGLAAAGCSSSSPPPASSTLKPSGPPPVKAAQARTLLDAFDRAVLARDQAAAEAAVPAASTAARRGLSAVYQHLSPLSWASLSTVVTATPGGPPGTMDVQFTGSPGGAGPADRVVAELLLQFGLRGGVPTLVADRTFPRLAGQGIMAFTSPRQISTRSYTVIFDGTWKTRAAELGRLVPAARAVVAAVYHVRSLRPVAIYLFSSEAEVTASIGLLKDQVDHRILFFTHPLARVARTPWSPGDIGVVAPALFQQDSWTPSMLRHEIAHAFTLSWFDGLAHSPPFLKEGLAVAVESDRSYVPLRQAIALNEPISLLRAMQVGDIWASRTTDVVRLAYAEAGSTIRYVMHRWGFSRTYRWVRSVAGSDMTDTAIMNSTKRELGIKWRAFVSGWRAFATTL